MPQIELKLAQFNSSLVGAPLWEVIFLPRFWGSGAPGVKIVGPLDSQWEVSYTCVIHYDAIFLTVCELLTKMPDFLANSGARLETKMAAVRPF